MDSAGRPSKGGTDDRTTWNGSQFCPDEHTRSCPTCRLCTSTLAPDIPGRAHGSQVGAAMGSVMQPSCFLRTTDDATSGRQKRLSKRDKNFMSVTKEESTAKEKRKLNDKQQAMAEKEVLKPFDQAMQEGPLSLQEQPKDIFAVNEEEVLQKEKELERLDFVDLYQSEDIIARESIGGEIDLRVYAEKEWRGCTEKTLQMRQALQCKIPLLNSLDASITKIPQDLKKEGCHWIDHWHFPQRNQNTNALAELQICLANLLAQLQKWQVHDKDDCRAFLNDLGKNEWRLYEAIKLLMLNTAVSLYSRQQRAEDIPLFACLLFARETSSCPRDFFFNHLMHVGSSGGLEQVEMCLLGHTLGLFLHVFRLYKLNSEEFEVFYPEYNGTLQSEVVLLTEDDRHYNVLLKTMDSQI
uniref:OTU deubiquitinase with linear linkage specificity b n=1 Tax=Eptatretus burgeri TaxID=7764 RepID=A0A8C4N0X9_EPTBU